MKRAVATLLVGTFVFTVANVAFAVGTPDLRLAQATMLVTARKINEVTCTGLNNTTYSTIQMTYRGPENGESGPELTGDVVMPLTMVWNHDNNAIQGTGNITLTDPSSGFLLLKGKVTLVGTLSFPDISSRRIEARGLITADRFSNNEATGEELLANFEMVTQDDLHTLSLFYGFSFQGNLRDFSVFWNKQRC